MPELVPIGEPAVDSTSSRAQRAVSIQPPQMPFVSEHNGRYLDIVSSVACDRVKTEPLIQLPIKLSILMCAFNEQETIAAAVNEVITTEYPCEIELIVVNDGSTDNTQSLLGTVRDPRITIYNHDANLGKGAALITAISAASGSHAVPFDADSEYSAEDIPRMLAPIIKGKCDVVYGTRLFGCNTVYASYRYASGNRILTRLANLLYDACLTDLHTCLKLVPLDMLRRFKLRQTGFGLDTELTVNLLRRGVRPFEVPISYYGRSRAEGKKITWRDALIVMHTDSAPYTTPLRPLRKAPFLSRLRHI